MGRDNRSRRGRGRSSGGSSAGGDTTEGGIAASGVLDAFTDVDNILREVQNTLSETNDTLQSLSANQSAVAELLADMTNQEVDVGYTSELSLVSAEVVPASGSVVEDEIRVPEDGILSQVYLTWPQGSNQSIGIGVVGVDGESLVPFGPANHKFIALDDVTVDFDLQYPVSEGETLTVRYVNNRNADEDAYPSVILVITEER